MMSWFCCILRYFAYYSCLISILYLHVPLAGVFRFVSACLPTGHFLSRLFNAASACSCLMHLFPNNLIVGKSGSLLNDAQHFLACTVFMCIQLFSAVKFCQAYRERNRKGLTYGDADRVCLSYTHDPVSWQTRDSWVLSRFCARFFSLFSEALRTTRIWCQRSSSTTWSAGMSNFHAVAASSCVFHLNTLDTMVQGRRPKWQRNTSSNRHCLNKACEDQRIKMDYAWLRKSVTMQRQPRSFSSIFLGTSCEEKKWIEVCAASELLEGQSKLLKLKEEFLGLRTYVRCLGKLWEQHLLRQLQRLLVFYYCSVAAHAITMPLHKQSPTWT